MGPASGPRYLLLPIVGAVAVSAGCVDYHWESDPNRAFTRARQENKDLFLYFRNGFSPQCGRMEREVLQRAEVAELFQNSVNCWIEFFWYQPLAQRYGLVEVPSYVIERSDGRRRVHTGFMPLEQFMAFARTALTPPPPTATGKAANARGG